MCWLERRLNPAGEGVFVFWSHLFAFLPGLPGLYLRRAFYQLTLESCSPTAAIGFGALFCHRQTRVAEDVYVGPYAVMGSVHLGKGCMIGTRVSLLSGSLQHEWLEEGGWAPSDPVRFSKIEIGEHVWIGEAAIVMADVGAGSMVAAGTVVSAPIPPGIIVAGNPARFVRDVVGQDTARGATRGEEMKRDELVHPLH
jgi:acetyltransferase-like isoleucine patch superfamily enzyme